MEDDLDARIKNTLEQVFNKHAVNGILDPSKLDIVFKESDEALPTHSHRGIAEEYAKSGMTITLREFFKLVAALSTKKAYQSRLMRAISSKEGVITTSIDDPSVGSSIHTTTDTEMEAFITYINRMLKNDKEVEHILPINKTSMDLFTKMSDGIILCKLLNLAAPGTIDKRSINLNKLNKFTITENLNLALNSCKALGLYVINIGAEDISSGTPHLVLGLLWQILRIVLFSKLNLTDTPNLAVLLLPHEKIQDLLRLSPEELLLRWVNYQLGKYGSHRKANNFGSDFKDGEIYAVLIERCLPNKKISGYHDIMRISDETERAEEIIRNFEAADLPYLLTAKDIVRANQKLNMAFLANLFNLYSCLDQVEKTVEIIDETREEKMFRNWLNSQGVRPYVNYLYSDLTDGIALLHMLTIMDKSAVNQNKINKHPMNPARASFLKVENCQYVIDICKQLGLSLPGIGSNDIATGSNTFTLGLLFQLMRCYTLRLLQELSPEKKAITEQEIVAWANQKSGVEIKSFKDQSIKTSEPLLKLIEAIYPKSINFDFVTEDRFETACYTISCARKIGASVYALPEDISDGNARMILTIYACLMMVDLKRSK